MSNGFYGPRCVTDDLVICLDAASNRSVPDTGTTTVWYDLCGNVDTDLLSNATYDTGNFGSFDFEAANDGALIMTDAQADIYTAIPFSVFVWFKSERTNDDRNDARVINRDPSDYWTISVDQGIGYPQSFISIVQGGGTNNYASKIDNGWHYGGLVFDASNYHDYLNGDRLGGGVYSFITSNTRCIALFGDSEGDTPRVGYEFLGKCARVEIYRKALSAAEVKQNYNALRGRFGR